MSFLTLSRALVAFGACPLSSPCTSHADGHRHAGLRAPAVRRLRRLRLRRRRHDVHAIRLFSGANKHLQPARGVPLLRIALRPLCIRSVSALYPLCIRSVSAAAAPAQPGRPAPTAVLLAPDAPWCRRLRALRSRLQTGALSGPTAFSQLRLVGAPCSGHLSGGPSRRSCGIPSQHRPQGCRPEPARHACRAPWLLLATNRTERGAADSGIHPRSRATRVFPPRSSALALAASSSCSSSSRCSLSCSTLSATSAAPRTTRAGAKTTTLKTREGSDSRAWRANVPPL